MQFKNSVQAVFVIILSDNNFFYSGVRGLLSEMSTHKELTFIRLHNSRADFYKVLELSHTTSHRLIIFSDCFKGAGMPNNQRNILLQTKKEPVNTYKNRLAIFLGSEKNNNDRDAESNNVFSLTEQEKRILNLYCHGYAEEGIMEKYRLSRKAMSRHRQSIIKKLELRNRIDLYKLCIFYRAYYEKEEMKSLLGR